MNVIFKTLSIRNFLSIAEEVLWQLTGKGLVLIEGENQDSQVADSNGSGKSTLFEGLVWCIWGKMVRGGSGDAVINRKVGKDCSCFLEFTYGGVGYSILRCRKHETKKNSLELWSFDPPTNTSSDLTQATMALTQEKIDEILGIDYDTFIRGPMMPQGSFKRFSQMTDMEVKSVLEQALQIEKLAEARGRVRQLLRQVEMKESTFKTALDGAKTSITLCRERLSQYQTEGHTFEKNRIQRVADLEQQVASGEEQKKEILKPWGTIDPTLIATIGDALRDSKEKSVQIGQMMQELRQKWVEKEDALRQHLSGKITLQATLDHEKADLVHRHDAIEELVGQCPTCERPITPDGVAASLDVIDSILKMNVKALREVVEEVGEAKRALKELQEKRDESLDGAEVFVRGAATKIRAFENQINHVQQAQRELELIDKHIQSFRTAAVEATNAQSPFANVIDREKLTICDHLRKIQALTARVAACERQLRHLKFWEEGFSNRGIKSLLLESVTPFMNQRAAHYSQALSDGEIKIEFSTQTTLKSGEVREQFSVQVTNENGADTYAGNSGGEKGRADLAINFVLSDLVASRARKAFPQRFFDEPFEGLDESGVDAVMALLSSMAVDAGSVFVITHQPGMKGLFDGTLTVVKEGGRSVLR